MFNKTIEQFMATDLNDYLKQVVKNLDILKKTSDLNDRIQLKATIQVGREQLLAKLMIEDIHNPERFSLGEQVICWHPTLYYAWGEIKGEVVGIETEVTGERLVKVMASNGVISRFAPQFMKHDIPREILSFSYWP